MKFLLTSAGITNASIQDALVDLLGKPIADSNALCIPTATFRRALEAVHPVRTGSVLVTAASSDRA